MESTTKSTEEGKTVNRDALKKVKKEAKLLDREILQRHLQTLRRLEDCVIDIN